MNCQICNNMAPHVHEPMLEAEIAKLRAEVEAFEKSHVEICRMNNAVRKELYDANLQNGVWVDLLREMHSAYHGSFCGYSTVNWAMHTDLCRKVTDTMQTWAKIGSIAEKPKQECAHSWAAVDPDSAKAVRSKCRICDAISPKTVEEQTLKRIPVVPNEHCKNGPKCAAYDCDCECQGCRKSMGCA